MNLWFLTRSIELYFITIVFLNLKCHSHNVDLVYWNFYEFLCRVSFLSLNSYLDNQTFLIGRRRCYHNRSTRFPILFNDSAQKFNTNDWNDRNDITKVFTKSILSTNIVDRWFKFSLSSTFMPKILTFDTVLISLWSTFII